ncbi:hypothetical protein [Cytobacillus solani]|uniref:Fur-regulated basic protein FbpA n=1 Tax=Cytobacillus solani TaxID=1637975 RepID=A0A0Q3QJB9_9BACI|nr:hypothetical protein [Cytobacillus solani]KQL17656.1 hypothetical protein AN957_02860 [Cytobacillus solani]
MGILYDFVKKVNVHQEMKRNIILEDLIALGIIESQQGISVYELDYDELKYELVMASFRQIDIQNDQNKWF